MPQVDETAAIFYERRLREEWERCGGTCCGSFFYHPALPNYEGDSRTCWFALVTVLQRQIAALVGTIHPQDGYMCEKHPGQEWGRCAGGPDCAGPGMPWILRGRREIEDAISYPRPVTSDGCTTPR